MAGPALDHSYSYPGVSAFSALEHGSRLRLVTSGGQSPEDHFFSGTARDPALVAVGLLSVSRVARARFYVPPAMLERILAEADPVVTSDGEQLRFESFSSCCGVYARLDLSEEACAADARGRGTTNVDFNPDMRAALAGVSSSAPFSLRVGKDAVEVETSEASVTERRVPLPVRWLKGFVEAQRCQAGMEKIASLSGTAALRWLRKVPRQTTRGPVQLVAGRSGLRIAQRATGGHPAAGIERLALLEALMPSAKALHVYTDGRGATGWQLDLGGARFTLALSPERWRGFSGEGQVLQDLAADDGPVASLRAKLHWQPRLSAEDITGYLGCDGETAQRALTALGAHGMVGYDLHEGTYFHRELPFNLAQVERLHPRLAAARELVVQGDVTVEEASGDDVRATVAGSGVTHSIALTAKGYSCTCTWFAKHQQDRGPCKHVLAAQIAREES